MGSDDGGGPRYPIEGISPDDLAAALAVMAGSPEIGAVRILGVEVRYGGHLLVETGFRAGIRAGAGRDVLLRKSEDGWSIVKVVRWKS